jgi:hypothetical protein
MKQEIYYISIYVKISIEIYYKMNYLDLLPDDETKIINRKVQDLHIIERRKEQKKLEK